MSEPFIGEIRMFAGNFAPRGWAYCDGQLLAIAQNETLFILLGTMYGGDGRTTFGLPDLRGRIPIHAGAGPGLTTRTQGERLGQETVTVAVAQMPAHTHALQGSGDEANSKNPRQRVWARAAEPAYAASGAPAVGLNAQATSPIGGGQAHSNLMPFLCVHFIIALEGVYPSRS